MASIKNLYKNAGSDQELGVYIESGSGPGDHPTIVKIKHTGPRNPNPRTLALWAWNKARKRNDKPQFEPEEVKPGVWEIGDDAVYVLSVPEAKLEFETLAHRGSITAAVDFDALRRTQPKAAEAWLKLWSDFIDRENDDTLDDDGSVEDRPWEHVFGSDPIKFVEHGGELFAYRPPVHGHAEVAFSWTPKAPSGHHGEWTEERPNDVPDEVRSAY